MAKNITVIPATKKRGRTIAEEEIPKKRVAAYCRVSTDTDEQATSYEAQVEHYTNFIKGKSEWEFAGIYADDGISGTNTRKREEFNRMIDDCMAGKIDMVITKSISRFARNTLDCLKYIRQLKEREIPVFFEKENINTMDAKGEVLLTIMASLAQQESQSMSQNIRLGYQFRFQEGKVKVNYARFLGYTQGEDGQLVIVPEEAEIVKRIFREYLEGASVGQIAKNLEADGILTGGHKTKWHASTIRGMLENEKYMGDALLQKTYTVDFLTKKKVKNDGMAPQYYVENSHPAIIPKNIFLMTQSEIARRAELYKEKRGYSGKYALTGIVECAHCGEHFRRVIWNNRGCKSTVWRCVSRVYKKTSGIDCPARTVNEEELHAAIVEAINEALSLSDGFYERYKHTLEVVLAQDNSELLAAIEAELRDRQLALIKLSENDPEYDNIVNDILELKDKKLAAMVEKAKREDVIRQADELIEIVKNAPTGITEYDERLVRKLISNVRINDCSIMVTFKTGYETVIEK